MAQFRARKLKYADAIRTDIDTEIEKYANAHDLDLVFEKAVRLQGKDGGVRPAWPVVHYVTPRLEITEGITLRLNKLYRTR
jgi:hypothetical protein